MGVFIAPGPVFVFINVNVLKLLHAKITLIGTFHEQFEGKLFRFAQHGTGSNHRP
jgi:hypothetical protein